MSAGSASCRRRIPVFLSLALFGIVAFAADRASACSCARVSAEEHLGYADVVLTGELTETGWPWWSPWGWIAGGHSGRAVIRVDRVFKGDVGPSAEFTYQLGDGANCGLFLQEDSRGVFLLAEDDGALTSNLCLFDLGMDVDAITEVLGEGRAP